LEDNTFGLNETTKKVAKFGQEGEIQVTDAYRCETTMRNSK